MPRPPPRLPPDTTPPADSSDRDAHPDVIPVVVEQAVVSTVTRDTGGWRIEMQHHTDQVELPLTAVREEVSIEHRPIYRWLDDDESPVPREEDDARVFPVIEEVPVVQLRRRLVEEVVVRRHHVTRERRETLTLRRNEVAVTRLPPAEQNRSQAIDERVGADRKARPLPTDGPAHNAPDLPSDARSPTVNQTIIAVFDSVADAERARSEIVADGIPADAVRIQSDQGTTSARSSATTARSSNDDEGGITGFFRRLFGFDDDDADVSMYSEAVRRGNCILSVDCGDERQQQRIEAILQRCGAIDIDERAQSWRDEGWSGTAGTASIASGEDIEGGTLQDRQSIPVVQEEMQVGKRVVQRGGLRIYSRIIEQPIEESVNLREEHASVQRHAVDPPATDADLANMRETSVEIRESVEEPVVSTQARVVEEVEVGKQVSDRTETVRGTVRKTDVDVERVGQQSPEHATASTTTPPANKRTRNR